MEGWESGGWKEGRFIEASMEEGELRLPRVILCAILFIMFCVAPSPSCFAEEGGVNITVKSRESKPKLNVTKLTDSGGH